MPDTTARQKLLHRYMWLVVTVGSTIFLYSAQNLPYQQLDFRFLLLFLLTAVISSRIAIRIPRANTTITVADTFVFLTLLLYGPEAAVVVATIDGLSSGLHLSRRWIRVLFNAGASASPFSPQAPWRGCCSPLNSTFIHNPFRAAWLFSA
jgi:hypothetical protein